MTKLLVLALGVCVAHAAFTELQQRILSIAKGQHNNRLYMLWQKMEEATAGNKKSGNKQYLLATKLLWNDEDQLSVNSEEVKYFSNIDTTGAKNTCDAVCLSRLNNINTKYNVKWTIEGRAASEQRPKSKGSVKAVSVHTELLFLYGKEFREQLENGGIFLIYSKFIPCAGLAESSFGECSGDLAAALKDLRESYEVYFVIMYSKVY